MMPQRRANWSSRGGHSEALQSWGGGSDALQPGGGAVLHRTRRASQCSQRGVASLDRATTKSWWTFVRTQFGLVRFSNCF